MKRIQHLLICGLVYGLASAFNFANGFASPSAAASDTITVAASVVPAWSVAQCVRYALQHSLAVREAVRMLDDYRIERTQSIGAFLPAVNGSVGAQYNFGRAVDPETNTYTRVNTFYNSYNLQASLPVFDGFARYHDLKAAQARVLMGKHGMQAKRDEVAQQVMKGCMDVLYYEGTVRLAVDKHRQSQLLLRQTQVMQEIGTKCEADVAQVKATVAADAYEITHQQNLLMHARLALKRTMHFPVDDSLRLDTVFLSVDSCLPKMAVPSTMPSSLSSTLPSSMAPTLSSSLPSDATSIYQRARLSHPQLQQAVWEVKAARSALRAARGGLFPSLSLGAGVSTSFYKTLGAEGAIGFRTQFKENRGEYVFATLSIPIFNRLQLVGRIRKQRNELRRAMDHLANQQSELQRLIGEAVADCVTSERECRQLAQKVEADAWAARLTLRKYEEGLASALEVQSASVALIQSQAAWLKSRLMRSYLLRMLDYYQGVPLCE